MKSALNMKKTVAAVLVLLGGLPVAQEDKSAILADALAELGAEPEGYVVSGYIRLHNWGQYALEKLLGQELNCGENTYSFCGEEVKIVLSGTKQKSVSMQLISKNRLTAERSRRFWQYFADTWGQGEIIGITVPAKAYEEMSPSCAKEFCAELAFALKACGTVHEDKETTAGAYYTPKLARAVNIAGKQINYNIAICPRSGYTDIYLGYPLIYQTY